MKKSLKSSCVGIACILAVSVGVTELAVAESIAAKENLEKLLTTNSCKNCDLSEVNLNRVDLSDADLEGADLSGAKMFLTNLSRANLRNANLKGAGFGGADLADADLRGADLRGTSLDGAYLGGTLLDGVFVTTTPYASDGVEEIEKELYIDDPAKPKKRPETQDVVVAPRRVFEEPPPALQITTPSEKKSKEQEKVLPEKTPEVIVKPVVDQSYPQAPVVKKVAQPKKANIVEKPAPEKVEVKKSEKIAAIPPIVQKATPQVKKDTKIKPVEKVKVEEKIVQKVAVVEEVSHAPVASMSEKNKNLLVEKKKRDNLDRLLDTNRCFDCDLSGQDLSGKNLSDADLEKANLTGCNLEGVDLEEANLKGTLLVGVNLRDANLSGADFYKADLSDADLTGADVENAMFDNATLSGTVGLAGPSFLLKE